MVRWAETQRHVPGTATLAVATNRIKANRARGSNPGQSNATSMYSSGSFHNADHKPVVRKMKVRLVLGAWP